MTDAPATEGSTSRRPAVDTSPTANGANGANGADDRVTPLRPIIWRLHFLGGFLAAPIAVWLALTGIVFAWNPQIESLMYGDQREATAEGDPISLEAQVDAVRAVYPEYMVTGITPSEGPGDTTAVALMPMESGDTDKFGVVEDARTVWVDPVDAGVTGDMVDAEQPQEWIRNLHSSFRLGWTANNLSELAASWVLVSLITGLYLWWPKSGRALRRSFTLRPRGLRGGGRRPWRNLHSTIGVLLCGVLAMLVVTGLTWSEHSGDWVDITKDALPAESPALQTDLGGGSTDGGGAHHAAGGAEAMEVDFAGADTVVEAVSDAGMSHPYTITPPAEMGQAWTAAEADATFPIQESSIAVDPESGEVLDRLETSDQSLIDQATTVGIGFHEGTLFGLFNQILLTVVALMLIVLVASGYVTWWRRRPPGALAAPPKMGSILKTVPAPVLIGFGVLMVLMPTLGVSFVAYLIVERIVRAVRGPSGGATPGEPTPEEPAPAGQTS